MSFHRVTSRCLGWRLACSGSFGCVEVTSFASHVLQLSSNPMHWREQVSQHHCMCCFSCNSCMFTKHRSGGPSLLQSIGYSGEDKISRGDCPHLQLLLPAGKIQGVLPERQSTISSRSKLVLCSYLIHC